MSLGFGIGHDRRGAGRLYAVVVAFDTELLQASYPGPNWNDASDGVKRDPTARGFTGMQGSTCSGDASIDAVRPCRPETRSDMPLVHTVHPRHPYAADRREQ